MRLTRIYFPAVLLLILFGCSHPSKDITWVDQLDGVDAVNYKSDVIQMEFFKRRDSLISGKRYKEQLVAFTLFLHANDLYKAAIPCYEKLMEVDPTEAKWPYLYSRILQDYGRVNLAVEMLEKSFTLNQDYPLTHLKKADLLAKTGETDLAFSTYEECLAQGGDLAYVHLGIARIHMQRKQWEFALKALNESINADTTFATSYFLLSTVQEHLGNDIASAKAKEYGAFYGRHRDPDDPWLESINKHCFDVYKISVAADLYGKTRRVEKAIEFYERAISYAPKDAEIYLSIAKLLIRNKRNSEAMYYIERSLELDPKNETAYIAKAGEYALKGNNRKALSILDVGLINVGPSTVIYRQRGVVLDALGYDLEKELMFLKAVELEPESEKCNSILANHFWTKGDFKSAVYYYERARKLSILETKPRAMLATYYIEHKAFAKAEACIEEIEAIDPDLAGLKDLKVSYFLRFGNHAFQLNDFEKAMFCFRNALMIDPRSEESFHNLVTLLVKTNELSKARQVVELMINKYPKNLFFYRTAVAVYLELTDYPQAIIHLKAGIAEARASGNNGVVVEFEKQLKIAERKSHS